MTEAGPVIIALAAVLFLALIAFASLKIAPAGSAIIRQGLGGTRISTGALIVVPGLHRMRVLDLTLSRLALSFRGPSHPLISQDQQLFDLEITIFYRLSEDSRAMEDAIKHFGADTLNDEAALVASIRDDAANAIRAAAGKFTWKTIKDQPQHFKQALFDHLPRLTPGLNVEEIALAHTDTFPPTISAHPSSGLLFREL